MAAVELILLQRVEKLGQMGDVVKVKPGLRPQLPAAAEEGAARQQGQPGALRAAARAARGAEPEAPRGSRTGRRTGRRIVRGDHPPGGRVGQPVRLGVGARYRGGRPPRPG